jgi:hypothetical protein
MRKQGAQASLANDDTHQHTGLQFSDTLRCVSDHGSIGRPYFHLS